MRASINNESGINKDFNSEDCKINDFATTNITDFKESTKIKEDDYDTDIEIKEEKSTYDHSGRSSYIKFCKKEGVIPAGYFLRNINSKKLDMRHHGLGLNGIKPVCLSLMNNGSITSLDLTDNWLGDQSVPYLMAMMKENCFISDLSLANNKFTSKSAQTIAISLTENMQLKKLNLSQNLFDDKSAFAFGELIAYSSKLEYLDFSKNQFGSSCMALFGKALSQNNSLIEFNISWNHLAGKETKQFAAGFSENNSITKLNIGWNGLGCSQSMQDLGKMLKTNVTLEELDLTNNRISPEGAVLLGRGLMVNNTLKVLKMGQNPMQTAGCYAVLSSILKNPNSTVKVLDFEDIRVNQDFIDLKLMASEYLNIYMGSRKPIRPSSCIHPVKRLKAFVRKHNLSIVKYFDHFNDSGNLELTVNDFRLTIQYFCRDNSFDMTENELNMLINFLDKKQNGYINYKDFIEDNNFQVASKNKYLIDNEIIGDTEANDEENETVKILEEDNPV